MCKTKYTQTQSFASPKDYSKVADTDRHRGMDVKTGENFPYFIKLLLSLNINPTFASSSNRQSKNANKSKGRKLLLSIKTSHMGQEK